MLRRNPRRNQNQVSNTGSNGGENAIPSGSKRKCIGYGPESVNSYATTELRQDSFAFLWTLHNYSIFSVDTEVKSPVFYGGSNKTHSWQFKVCPKRKVEGFEYFSLYLIITDLREQEDLSHKETIKVKLQISLLGADGKPGKKEESSMIELSEKLSMWGSNKFISSIILNSASLRLVEDNAIKIHCRVWIHGELEETLQPGGITVSKDELKEKNKERLANDFGKLFNGAVMPDLAITTRDKTTIMAHKAVLGARSQVFKAMFTTNMVESNVNSVDIPDFDDEVIKGMLEFIYTAKTDVSELALDLLQISEKYNLEELKEDCEEAIAKELTVENAGDLLVLAYVYNASILKPRVINYINCNKNAVQKTTSFRNAAKTLPSVFVDLYLS